MVQIKNKRRRTLFPLMQKHIAQNSYIMSDEHRSYLTCAILGFKGHGMSNRTSTGQQAVLQIEAEAAAYGVVRSTDSQGRARFEVTCGDCGKQTGMFNSSKTEREPAG